MAKNKKENSFKWNVVFAIDWYMLFKNKCYVKLYASIGFNPIRNLILLDKLKYLFTKTLSFP